MSELFLNSDSAEIERKKFTNFTLDIVDLPAIEAHVNGNHNIPTFSHLADGIKYGPIRCSYLRYNSEEPEGETLYGVVDCDPLLSTQKIDNRWDTEALDGISQQIEATFSNMKQISVPHNPAAVYFAELDADHAFCIQTSSNLESSQLSVTTILQERLHAALGHDTLDADTIPTLAASTISQHATIWGITQNYIIDTYVNAENHTERHTDTVQVALPQEEDADEATIAANLHQSEDSSYQNDPFDAVGGLFDVKEKLRGYLDILTSAEMASEQYDVAVPSFILYGPPGGGKTLLIEAFAESAGAELVKITPSAVQGAHIGGTSALFEKVFATAFSSQEPIVLCFDEIDRYLDKDLHKEFQKAAKTFGELVSKAREYPHVFVIGATNAPPDQLMDSAVRAGRFETIRVDLAQSEHEQADVWRAVLGRYATLQLVHSTTNEKLPLFTPPVSLEDILSSTPLNPDSPRTFEFAQESDGLSGADIHAIVDKTRLDKFALRHQDSTLKQITHQDILQAIRNYKRHDSRPSAD